MTGSVTQQTNTKDFPIAFDTTCVAASIQINNGFARLQELPTAETIKFGAVKGDNAGGLIVNSKYSYCIIAIGF